MPNVYTFKNFVGSSHRILLSLIRSQGRGNLLVDLGSAGGELGRALDGQFRHRIGYEGNVDCLGLIRHSFDRAIIADLESIERIPAGADAVVLADILEHLRHQKPLLQMVRRSLAPGGRLYVSVPNIANITIRIGLLFGIFRYRERGILDETHVRFYTLSTIREELEAAGFRVLKVRGSSVPVRLIVGSAVPEPILVVIERLLLWITQLWKSLMAYQIILVAASADDRARQQ